MENEKIRPLDKQKSLDEGKRRIDKARRVLEKTDFASLVNAIADTMDISGEYYDAIARFEADHTDILEAIKEYQSLPEVWSLLRDKVDKDILAQLLEISVRGQIISRDIQNWKDLSIERKLQLGGEMKELARAYRALAKTRSMKKEVLE